MKYAILAALLLPVAAGADWRSPVFPRFAAVG